MGEHSKITLKSIADRLGTSVTTVSRVLSGKASQFRISEKTEEAVWDVAKSLQFSPNQIARGLRLQRSFTLGLIIPDISNHFFATIARNIEIEARKFGFSIIICDSQESTEIENESLKLLQSRKVDGLIISSVGQNGENLEKIYKKGMPLIIVDRYFPNLDIPYVASDNFKGALEGVSYLIENGHRVIACLQGLLNSAPNEDRVRGYKEAHYKNNIQLDESLIVGDSFSEKNAYIETKLLLKRESPPTAIFAVSNSVAFGAIRAISEEDLKLPDDISIVSFDEEPYSEYLFTPMTTISQQKDEMGAIAVRLLINQIQSKNRLQTDKIKLPTELIKRKSVKNINQNV